MKEERISFSMAMGVTFPGGGAASVMGELSARGRRADCSAPRPERVGIDSANRPRLQSA
jgi:hypothetical protein